ncbi:MAG: 16S rRNA (guanine(527)-N(7))-methyltransferase RsmG [Coriobacteriaceae bacterium]|nr:16S rRNA (guanine(527)-N(7))-methyltransferase RsmG [Coriobacteriaceae bacterium]
MKHTSEERAAVDAALLRLKLDFNEDITDKLITNLKLVIEKNKVLNLTRIDSFEDAVVLHLEDSLSIYPEFMHSSGEFCDIGTGGGFPGLPLAIASGRKGILLDSVKKKALAVQEFVEELSLAGQVQALGMRSEELCAERFGEFDTVVARAVDKLSVVEEYAGPLLASGGHLIAMRGTESLGDEKAAQIASEQLGLQMIEKRAFSLGPDEVARSVYVFEKNGSPSIKLPRRPGMAHKKPLGY